MKKWYFSALLALVTVFSMSIPALAADEAPDAPVPVEAEPEVPIVAADEPAAIAAANGWVSEGGSWYYYKNGQRIHNDWLLDRGVWYFLDPDGKMLEGFAQIDLGRADDGWYYFSEKHDGTYGHVMTGWQWITIMEPATYDPDVIVPHEYWYYFDPKHNGTFGRAYDNGWNVIGGKYYYFFDNGHLAIDCDVDGYHVDSNGVRGREVGPWFTDEELRRAEQELFEYAKEKYGLKAQKRTGTYAHDFYFGLDWVYPTIDGMKLKADNEYDGLIEYGKFCVDQTFRMWAGGRANYGDVGIFYEYDDTYNDWGYGNWGYHIHVFYGTSDLL